MTILIVTVFFAFETMQLTRHEDRFSKLQTDSFDSIRSERRVDPSLSLDLSFNGVRLFYDPGSRTYYYSMPEYEAEKYDPLVSWESNRINVVFEKQKIDNSLISSDTGIRVLIYDRYRYSTRTIKCTTLPLINIDKFYDEPSFTYDESVITFYDNRDGFYDSYDGKVRIRGGITAQLDKPGLRIELDKYLKGDNNTQEKYYDIFGLETDNEYVLYTCNVEKDHIRNVFSTNLWYESCADDNAFGLKLGMSYRLCEVFINNKYWGLCALGNPISEKRGYVDLNPNSEKYPLENIYKMNFFGDRELLDYETYQKDFLMALKTNIGNKRAWKPYTDFVRLLQKPEGIESLYTSVDMDNALDIYLFYNLTQAWDNAWFEDNLKMRNTYLVSKIDNEGNIRFLYIPWDLDRTWGHCREDGLEYPLDYTVNYPMVVTPIENLLDMKDERIGLLLYGKYLNLRKDKWSDEKIFAMIEEYEKEVYGSGAFLRDTKRWPGNYHADNTDLSEFKEYVSDRLKYFDAYMYETFGDAIMEKN